MALPGSFCFGYVIENTRVQSEAQHQKHSWGYSSAESVSCTLYIRGRLENVRDDTKSIPGACFYR